MADPKPVQDIARPTPTSERTVAAIVAIAFLEAAGLGVLLVFHKVDANVAHYLGIGLLVLVAIPVIIALAFASPWLGTERIRVGADGLSLEHSSEPPPPAPPPSPAG